MAGLDPATHRGLQAQMILSARRRAGDGWPPHGRPWRGDVWIFPIPSRRGTI